MPSLKASIPSVKSLKKITPSSDVLCEGYLMKQNHGRYKSWVKRYFVLYDGDLRYYKNKNDTNALAAISLDHYSLASVEQPSCNQSKQLKSNIFYLLSDDDNKYDWPDYHLQATNEADLHIWMHHLQSCVFQPVSVLEKWLDRLDIPYEDKPLNHSIDAHLSPSVPRLPSSAQINHFTPRKSCSVKSYKSVESFNTISARSCCDSVSNNSRRPSTNTSISSKMTVFKMFSWSRSRSTTSSLLSSSKSTHEIDLGSTETLVLPSTTEKSDNSPYGTHMNQNIYAAIHKPIICSFSH